ncbi:helix-turn-helix domain-containing protein [Nostoc sp. CHAB 5715]|nr:helix-turn-helix domain-containing protein [Nostoc sp. CHAB 5715]MCC5626518.1 helix-turn-helix domain-containing protein [Nostoc sp. CHAB 5715]
MEQVTLPEVLTLEETSAYLRLPTQTVVHQAMLGNIPGRKIQDDWRFLKVAIDDWLRSKSGRAVLLQQVGTLADDDTLAQLRTAIYHSRQRSEVDTESVD